MDCGITSASGRWSWHPHHRREELVLEIAEAGRPNRNPFHTSLNHQQLPLSLSLGTSTDPCPSTSSIANPPCLYADLYTLHTRWPRPHPKSSSARPSVPPPRISSARRYLPYLYTAHQLPLARPCLAGLARDHQLTLYSQQWDQCLSNLVVKSALGAGFGIIFSILIFKRRAWPVSFGLGFGAGRGYSECDQEFKGAASGVTKAVGERLQRP